MFLRVADPQNVWQKTEKINVTDEQWWFICRILGICHELSRYKIRGNWWTQYSCFPVLRIIDVVYVWIIPWNSFVSRSSIIYGDWEATGEWIYPWCIGAILNWSVRNHLMWSFSSQWITMRDTWLRTPRTEGFGITHFRCSATSWNSCLMFFRFSQISNNLKIWDGARENQTSHRLCNKV